MAFSECGFRPFELAYLNSFILANVHSHKSSIRITWLVPKDWYRWQIDCILVSKCWQSSVNTYRTHTFSRIDIGSDHQLVKMILKTRKTK